MSDETAKSIGLIYDGDPQRDAIHVAVAPVRASKQMKPGQRVGFVSDGVVAPEKFQSVTAVGIIDPFLRGDVYEGGKCWLFLFPGSITSLRHQWTHPAFGQEEVTVKSESRAWIEAFAVELDQTYSRLMEAAEMWQQEQEYTYDNSERYKDVEYSKWPIFWHHYEIVTGEKVADKEATFFTCSC